MPTVQLIFPNWALFPHIGVSTHSTGSCCSSSDQGNLSGHHYAYGHTCPVACLWNGLIHMKCNGCFCGESPVTLPSGKDKRWVQCRKQLQFCRRQFSKERELAGCPHPISAVREHGRQCSALCQSQDYGTATLMICGCLSPHRATLEVSRTQQGLTF